MNCEFDYCIYNKNYSCTLNKIEMNSFGQCENCIIVSLPKNILEEYKAKQLQKYETYN